MFHNRRILQSISKPSFVAAASASVWGDRGTFLDLSTTTITNDTVTSHDTSGFSTARGTLAHSTGKFYFEVKILSAPGANLFYIGLLDSKLATGAALDQGGAGISNTVCTNCNDGTASAAEVGFGCAGVNVGSGITLANNDILGVAFDATNGFHYLSKNGTFLTVGGVASDPTSGVFGTGHIGVYTSTANGTGFYPQVSIWGLVNAVAQLITDPSVIATGGRLPSGYTAWG